jgi:murein DD-endopeptidase MepM/ murein hydrolase activator NlpD
MKMHRVLAIAMVCASLYAGVLGQRAFAGPEATPTASADVVTPFDPVVGAAPPEADTMESTVSPSPEPVITEPSPAGPAAATPQPADQAATAAPGPSGASPGPTATPAPRADGSTEDDGSKRPRERRPDRPRPCGTGGALEGTVGEAEAELGGSTGEQPSTSTRRCREDGDERKPKRDRKKRAQREEVPTARELNRTALRRPDGRPTVKNPTYASASLGAAPIGVPNFFIDKFRIPPFLLPIYQAAGMEYGIRWEILAAINEIETDYGRNLNVSSAGALGWMQFMPPTWKAYGVDANRDGRKDPYNPVDAIFAAARYLKASGAATDLRKAVFAYNHADWYVDSVLMRARLLGGLPVDLVGSLTGLTQGRFPVYAKASYAGELKSGGRRARKGANAAFAVESRATRRDIRVFARRGAPVIAVNDGRVVAIGRSRRLGRYVRLQDVYGNTFTYANLGRVSRSYPVLRQRRVTRSAIARELELPRGDAAPRRAASTTPRSTRERRDSGSAHGSSAVRKPRAAQRAAAAPEVGKERLYAHPGRPNVRRAEGRSAVDFEPIAGLARFDRDDYESRVLRKGARVVAGTVLGRLGAERAGQAAHLRFEIRPAGRGAPRIDPKPILDGWKLLESTAVYRAAGRNPFLGRDAAQPSVGQILLMSKEALVRRVVRNPRVQIYECGERDIISGQVDRRVLATLEFLAASGLRPTVTSLKCGHGYFTASGNVSHHSSGNAVDIAAVNGIPILGNQGAGSITDITIQRLLTLQGTMKPDQIISLMTFEGTDNTFAMGDHHDHIHLGWRPLYGANRAASRHAYAILKPSQWIDLMARLDQIENPRVRAQPSRYAVKVTRRASHAHRGE